jgi:tetratricopeptide (TPR) repeat protein
MLSIFASTELLDQVNSIIAQVYRLDELVRVVDFFSEKPTPSASCLIVTSKGVSQPIDWYNEQPPFILPEYIDLAPNTLLGLLFAKLGNYQEAYTYLANDINLLTAIDCINRLQNGVPVNPDVLSAEYSDFEEYRLLHNQAIVRHYGADDQGQDYEKIRYFYREAMHAAPNDEYQAFTAKHYALLLSDHGDLDLAEDVLLRGIQYALSDDAKLELKSVLVSVWLKKLTIPYDQALLAQIKETLWEVLNHYEKNGRRTESGLLLVDASQVANFTESFAESLGYVNRALAIFEEEEQVELVANAFMRRGALLLSWAQHGNPQFFKGAAESYQEALKVFTREDAPAIFADIQHQLGIIYSEIPAEVRKKSIWAGVSSTAFKAALEFYTKEEYPYEYALISTHYGNALTKYPEAIHSDNFEKALFLYDEALAVRNAAQFPYERALTLLNYIEASWHVNNATEDFNETRFNDMRDKATEVLQLVKEPSMLEEANLHLEKLAALKKAYQEP